MNKFIILIILTLSIGCVEEQSDPKDLYLGNGIDNDFNGYSDDIDEYIKKKFPKDKKNYILFRKLHYQIADYYGLFLKLDETPKEALKYMRMKDKLSQCFSYIYIMKSDKKIKIREKTQSHNDFKSLILNPNSSDKLERLDKLVPSHVGTSQGVSYGYKYCEFETGEH